jgi:hypothetical protein
VNQHHPSHNPSIITKGSNKNSSTPTAATAGQKRGQHRSRRRRSGRRGTITQHHDHQHHDINDNDDAVPDAEAAGEEDDGRHEEEGEAIFFCFYMYGGRFPFLSMPMGWFWFGVIALAREAAMALATLQLFLHTFFSSSKYNKMNNAKPDP